MNSTRFDPPAPLPLVLVVAGLLRDQEGRVLLTQRPPGGELGLTWEFPGGKVEAGESPEEALARELEEEIGVVVEGLEPWCFVSHPYPRFHLLMVLFRCRRWRGEPVCRQVHDLGWYRLPELAGLAMPPADLPLVARLLREGEGSG